MRPSVDPATPSAAVFLQEEAEMFNHGLMSICLSHWGQEGMWRVLLCTLSVFRCLQPGEGTKTVEFSVSRVLFTR